MNTRYLCTIVVLFCALLLIGPALGQDPTMSACPPYDLDGDCMIDIVDFALLAAYFLADEIICDPGSRNCDGMYDNGCEIDVYSDLNNCGSCGDICQVFNATGECVQGICEINECASGYGNCNGIDTDGCETDTSTDLNHCGGCGQVCQYWNAVTACVQGACEVTGCTSGHGNCNGLDDDGCETNIGFDVDHCGGCGQACQLPNAVAACEWSECVVDTCVSGYGNCDGASFNGCEWNLMNSVAHCGYCGRNCEDFWNVIDATCNQGQCEVLQCSSGWDDCDGDGVSGCETDIYDSVANCGACGNDCHDLNHVNWAGCSIGNCLIWECDSDWGNCDGSVGNGCETYLNNNTNNCGACGNTCPSTWFCKFGECINPN